MQDKRLDGATLGVGEPMPGGRAVQAALLEPSSVSTELVGVIAQGITHDGGWWPFDRFMQAALYTPGLGYYNSGRVIFGASPRSGSDFITAPEMSPLFGQALAAQVRQVLDASGSSDVWELGAGTGALAQALLQTLGDRVTCYTIVDVSGTLRATQQATLAPWGERVHWASALPSAFEGVVIGNEVLDAVPFKRLGWDGAVWREHGVTLGATRSATRSATGSATRGVEATFAWSPRPTDLSPPQGLDFEPGTVTETHAQAEALVASISERLAPGAVALFIDYGFPEAEYYHPQRKAGSMMCHQAHQADDDPLVDVGRKDITTHINFTAVALAAQAAGAQVLGYTSQGRFLLNCGLADLMQNADLRAKNAAHRLLAEHEMGELFKVMALGKGVGVDLLGFAAGDRTHRL